MLLLVGHGSVKTRRGTYKFLRRHGGHEILRRPQNSPPPQETAPHISRLYRGQKSPNTNPYCYMCKSQLAIAIAIASNA